MFKELVIPIMGAIALTGCAMQPNKEKIQQLPVIQLGDTIPNKGEYILYFPAGKDITTTANIVGNIFQKEASQTIKVKLKRDIYNYKEWLSYDKKKWLSVKDALNIHIEVKLPSYTYPNNGKITLQLSEKE